MCAITVLGLSNGLADQRYPHCDKGVAETALIGGCGHIYAHGSGPDNYFHAAAAYGEKTQHVTCQGRSQAAAEVNWRDSGSDPV